MPKSMSLSDLAKNSKSVAPPQHKPMQDVVMEGDDIEDNVMKEPPKEIKASDKVITPQQPQGGKRKSNDNLTPRPGGGQATVKRINPSGIIANEVAAGKIKPKEEKVEDAPVIADAFKAMKERIDRSKHDIETIMMPIVMQNAQEIAMENQMEQEKAAETVAEQQVQKAETQHSAMSGEVSPFDLDPADFAELNEDNPNAYKPSRPVTFKAIDPSEREYDFEMPEKTEEQISKVESKGGMNMDATNVTMPVVSEEPESSQPIALPTQEELDAMVRDSEPLPEEVPSVDVVPAQTESESEHADTTIPEDEVVMPVVEEEETPKKSEPRVEETVRQAAEKTTLEKKSEQIKPVLNGNEMSTKNFHIESEDSPKIEKGKPSIKNDTLIDMDGNQVSIAKAMEDLDRTASGETADDDNPETQEEVLAKFRKMFEHTKIIKDPVDLSTYHIRKKPVGSAYILNNIQNSMTVKKADWALYHTHRAERYIECIGPELDNLRKTMSASNNINSVIATLRFIYDHVDDASKPDFDSWCRIHRVEDLNSQYFGIYRATYNDTNLIPRTCTNPKCKKTSLIETNIDDMVVYGGPDDDHDAIKKEFMAIYKGDTTTPYNAFKATLIQISDQFALAYTPSSLYSTFIQYSTLQENFTSKYSDLLDMLAHIDTFFFIDRNTGELVPIEIKEYPDNLTKTIMSRIQTFHGILNTLTTDQYNALNAKMDRVVQTPKITYRFPKVICPECGKEIPEAPVDGMLEMLFMRAQLARIKSL